MIFKSSSKLICSQIRYATTKVNLDELNHLYNPAITPPRQAWLETFIGTEPKKLRILDLHPSVFGVFPRPDYIAKCIQWQKEYRKVDYTCMPTRNELPGGTRKPWPQKGTGRARHGSVNSPIFLKGGWARGPRGPKSYFFMPPFSHLISSLQSTLTMKLAQNDLKIVDSLDYYQYQNDENEAKRDIEKDFEARGWGPSVLIIDNKDIFPEPLVESTKRLNHINLMPVYVANVLSMIKHETLVVTESGLREIESKILFHLLRVDLINTRTKTREKDPGL